MKLICIADTHNKHQDLHIPPGDFIIHAGDFTEAGSKRETMDFLNWFSALPHPYKILVAGNHDFYLEKHQDKLHEIIPGNINYLQDSGITLENIKFWGSPYTPGGGHWAFNKDRGTSMEQHWDKIPPDVDFLITHSPPYGIMDELDNKKNIGCEALATRIKEIKLPHHIFGHVHHDYGIVKTLHTVFINASSVVNRYTYFNSPLVIHHMS